jgi:hypothetical protein
VSGWNESRCDSFCLRSRHAGRVFLSRRLTPALGDGFGRSATKATSDLIHILDCAGADYLSNVSPPNSHDEN